MKKTVIAILALLLACTPALADVLLDLPAGEYEVVPFKSTEATATSHVRVLEGAKPVGKYTVGQRFFLEAGQSVSENKATVVSVLSATTDAVITFRNIPWLSDDNDTIEQLITDFPDINTRDINVYGEEAYLYSVTDKTNNFFDPESRYFPKLLTAGVTTQSVHLSNETGASGYSIPKPIGDVAGYPVNSIRLSFVDVDESIADEYALFESLYYFGELEDISRLEQFNDLKSKLSALYGRPYCYQYERKEPISTINAVAVWMGADGSGAYLEHTLYTDPDIDLLFGSESVTLHYGTAAVNAVFQAGIDQESAKAQQEATDKENRRQEIFNDNSGL